MTGLILSISGLSFLYIAAASAARMRSCFAPAVVWLAAWATLFLVAAIFGRVYNYDNKALAAACLLVASFPAGCWLESVLSRPESKADPASQYRGDWVVSDQFIVGCGVIGALGAVYLSKQFGSSFLSASSFSELFSMGQADAVEIFRGEQAVPAIAKAAFAVLQFGFLAAGFRHRHESAKRAGGTLLFLLLATLPWAIVTTQRSYFLVPLVWWLSGLIADSCLSRFTGYPIRLKVVVWTSGAIVVLVLGVVLLRAIRESGGANTNIANGLASSRAWFAGYLPAFSAWFHTPTPVAGQSSFPILDGVTTLFGPQRGLSGGYEYIGDFATSNATTIFRDFVASGGLLVAITLLVICGFAAQVCYRATLRGSAGGALAYASILAAVLWAPDSWFFNYGGRVLVVVLGVAYLAFQATRKVRPEEQRRPSGQAKALAARPRQRS